MIRKKNKWDDNFRPDGARMYCHGCNKMIDTHVGKGHIDLLIHQLLDCRNITAASRSNKETWL